MTNPKRLQLHRETFRVLSEREQQQVAAGEPNYSRYASACHECDKMPPLF